MLDGTSGLISHVWLVDCFLLPVVFFVFIPLPSLSSLGPFFWCPCWPRYQSFTGFLLGDLVAQAPEISSGGKWDAWRTAKMGSFGVLLHGPIGHYWYGFLDRTIMTKAPTSALAVASKTAIDQILWAPIFTSGFFAYMKTADGKASEIPEEVQSKLWDTMKVNWMTWIPGTWPCAPCPCFVVVRRQLLWQLVLVVET